MVGIGRERWNLKIKDNQDNSQLFINLVVLHKSPYCEANEIENAW